MTDNSSDFVFLMVCEDFGQAQVIRSFLVSKGFHPRVRDEQTRTIASHLGNALGKLTLEIPEHEYVEASLALETQEKERPRLSIAEPIEIDTQALAKSCLWNAILGVFIIPILCNLYSMSLGYRALKNEKPLTAQTRNRVFVAVLFNSFVFVLWFIFLLPIYFTNKITFLQ